MTPVSAWTGLADEPLALRLPGFRPEARVLVRATTEDEAGKWWCSWARYRADASGAVDVSTAKAEAGTYRGVDGEGLIWSMRLADGEPEPMPFRWWTARPQRIRVEAEIDKRVVATTDVVRTVAAPGVSRQPVGAGLSGALFVSRDRERSPGVIVLGGSGSAVLESTAALLASRGLAALALAYFGGPGLPQELVEVPIEYGARAIDWLRRHDRVRGDGVALLGVSKGGELALLLAANHPHVRAVVAYVPSNVAFAAVPHDYPKPSAAHPRSSWSRRGRPVPFVDIDTSHFTGSGLMRADPLVTMPAYAAALQTPAADAAALPVERINGPVMLVSAADDAVWPSTPMSELVMRRLDAHEHPYANAHLSYRRAGHALGFSHVPCGTNLSTRAGLTLTQGGEPRSTARARSDSWPRVVDFLTTERHRGAAMRGRRRVTARPAQPTSRGRGGAPW